MVCRGGGVAQLGERLLCKQEVIGSIPFTSTSLRAKRDGCHAEARRAKAGLFRATAEQAGNGRTHRTQYWIGRSKLFVGQQRPAFAIFDIVKSGVTEEASADAKSNLLAEEHFGNAEETSAVVLVFSNAMDDTFFGRVSSCETCLPCGALSCKR